LLCAGHSLGAALSVLFAQVLACRQPELAERVAAVYSFATPRVGDAEFSQRFSEAYCAPAAAPASSPAAAPAAAPASALAAATDGSGKHGGGSRAFRVCHGADIICHLPPRLLEYEDAGPEVFITSTGRVLFNPKVCSRAVRPY